MSNFSTIKIRIYNIKHILLEISSKLPLLLSNNTIRKIYLDLSININRLIGNEII